jgi:radical SAM superfamily enzyme YgiQ (UPF0313 family)
VKIFLGDLVHTWEKVSVWTMPLNVGFIGAYAQKMIPEIEEIRLFKRPEIMIEAIKEDRPDVVGLANYVWNNNLNAHVARIAKKINPNVLTVGGGPQFTSQNANEAGALKFFSQYPEFDAYVFNQGELGFTKLLQSFRDSKQDLAEIHYEAIGGILTNVNAHEGDVLVGKPLDPLRDLDDIPSPYLNGMLDSFFDEPLNPMIETNRSCPYRCTFCAWGIGTEKLSKFSLERVFEEIEYIAQRCTKTVNIHICDANFAILERDSEIAAKLYSCHKKYGFPSVVSVQWNKTRPDRTLRVAKELKEIAEIGASMQSFHPDTLSAIKRKNLPLENVMGVISELNKAGAEMSLFSELILGLPEETWQTHLDANKKLMDLGAQVHNYNLHLLPGTEMDRKDIRQKYFKRTGWRLHDNAFGIYDGKKVFEGQEVVLETSTMKREEIASFRYIHWIIQLMWGRRYYYDFLQLFLGLGVHPADFAVEIYHAMKKDDGQIGKIYHQFTNDYSLEFFETHNALFDYWSKDEPFERLRSGDYGKLNAVYSHKILLDHQNDFNDFLMVLVLNLIEKFDLPERDSISQQCEEILRFNCALRIALSKDLKLISSKRESFKYDILAWKQTKYARENLQCKTARRIDYEFFIPEHKKKMLETKLGQFRSHNLNLTWRKLTEYSNADQFFYDVRIV